MTEVKREEFIVEHTGKCKKVFIPKGYCTVYMQGAKLEDCVESQIGADVCIENTSNKMECQGGNEDATKEEGK